MIDAKTLALLQLSQGGNEVDVQELLGGSGDPRMELLSRLMTAQQAEEEETEETRTIVARTVQPDPELDERRRRVRARIAELRRERDDALDLLATLSAALGSCEECWGEDPHCPTCRGDGGPGWRDPEPESYDAWVRPANAPEPASVSATAGKTIKLNKLETANKERTQ